MPFIASLQWWSCVWADAEGLSFSLHYATCCSASARSFYCLATILLSIAAMLFYSSEVLCLYRSSYERRITSFTASFREFYAVRDKTSRCLSILINKLSPSSFLQIWSCTCAINLPLQAWMADLGDNNT